MFAYNPNSNVITNNVGYYAGDVGPISTICIHCIYLVKLANRKGNKKECCYTQSMYDIKKKPYVKEALIRVQRKRKLRHTWKKKYIYFLFFFSGAVFVPHLKKDERKEEKKKPEKCSFRVIVSLLFLFLYIFFLPFFKDLEQ